MLQLSQSKVSGFNRIFKVVLIITILFFPTCKTPPSAKSKLDVSGNWRVTILVGEDTIQGCGFLRQVGDSINGWVGPNENDPIDITGILNANILTIKTLPKPGRTVAFDKVDLEIKGDTMVGKIEEGSHGKGTIKFIRSK